MSAPHWTVQLRIVSETLSISEISTITGMAPDHSIERGTFRRGSSLARRFSSWEIESDLDAQANVTEHVTRILDRLAGYVDEFRRAAESTASSPAEGLVLTIVGRFDPVTDDSPGVYLTEDHVAFLASVRATLDVEIVPEPPASPEVAPNEVE